MNMCVQLTQRPRISSMARLRFDPLTQSYVLLSPERGLRLNESASEVVRHCDGTSTVQQIVEQLRNDCVADDGATKPTTEQVASEVIELLEALHERSLVVFEPGS